MVNNILKAFKDYRTTIKNAKKQFETEQAEIMRNYGKDGLLYADKMKKVNEHYNKTFNKAKQNGLDIITCEFNKINDVVKSFVAAPVPAEFFVTFEALKNISSNITETEEKLYLEKYKTNYAAYRALTELFHNTTGNKYYIVKYDNIKKDIDELWQLANDFFNKYNGNGYWGEVCVMEKNNIFKDLENNLNKFMNEDVSNYKQ